MPEWQATDPMVSAHAFHTSTLLGDGRVLVVGGLINDRLEGRVSSATELYDPGSGVWTDTAGLIEGRWGHTATLLPDGKVLVAGSHIGNGRPMASAELFDVNSGRWTTTGAMTSGRGGHTATLLLDGTVLVIGGGAEDTGLEGPSRSATAERYDPNSGTWTAIRSMNEARFGHSATLLEDGSVLVVGGSGNFLEVELYDPNSGRWTPTGSTSTLQGVGHTATLLADGRVLVAGGNPGSEWDPHATAELYDPRSGRWTPTGTMAAARSGHTASRLADGQVLVVGTANVRDQPVGAELYDPSSGRWVATANPAEIRIGFTATLMLDGRVLVAGNYDHESRASAEMFDPGQGGSD